MLSAATCTYSLMLLFRYNFISNEEWQMQDYFSELDLRKLLLQINSKLPPISAWFESAITLVYHRLSRGILTVEWYCPIQFCVVEINLIFFFQNVL